MVSQSWTLAVAHLAVLLGQTRRPQIMRLPPAARAKVIGALILLTIGGVALVVLAWLALRVGRRSWNRAGSSGTGQARRVHPDDWASKPLVTRPRGPVEGDE